MSRNNITLLLEKLENWDKDERYMGISDLCNELQKDVKLDASLEQRICAAVLKRLDDTSNDVQSKAIACLGILLKKVQQAQVLEISDKLCRLILEGSAELCDIYSIGLKTLVLDVPEEYGPGVSHLLVRPLLAGINNANVAIKLECLEIMGDLLKRFGAYPEVGAMHESVTTALLAQLGHERKAVQKKATACLGAAAVVLADPLLNALVDQLLASTQDSKVDARVLITTIGQISRSVGYRMGRHLDAIVPLFSKFLGDPSDEALQTEQHNDLREVCLQGFESFVLRCPREIAPYLESITAAACTFMKYDPNYVGDDSDDEGGGMSDDDQDEDDDNEYDDDDQDDEDDDTSWKVRRAAVKVLGAVVGSRPEGLAAFMGAHGAEVVKRFTEREEHVRLDVVECFATLVRTTAKFCSGPHHPQALVALQGLVPSVVTASLKQLGAKGDKTEKTKVALLGLLRELVEALPAAGSTAGGGGGAGGLEPFLDKLFANLGTCLADKSNALKLDALGFLRTAVDALSPASVQPHLPALLPLVLANVKADWYKIISEALLVVGVLVAVLRPLDDGGEMFDASLCPDPQGTLGPVVGPVFDAILPRLEASDIDQEIKECAIAAMGTLLAYWGDLVAPGQVATTMNMFADKLKNEITRMPAMKALQELAKSVLGLDLTPIFAPTLQELSSFLRQQSRPLKQVTLETLTALVGTASGGKCLSTQPELLGTLLAEAAPLVSDADLHLTHLSLTLAEQVLVASPAQGAPLVSKCVVPPALALSASPLLQGRALHSLLDLLRALAATSASSPAPGAVGFPELYSQLRASVDLASDAPPKQSIANVARCLSALLVQCPDAQREATVGELLKDLDGSSGESRRQLALLTVGEVGQHKDLSGVSALSPLVLASFDSADEATKTAASFALGSMAVGNMGAFLPGILEVLCSDKRKEYLLLASLKELIVLHAKRRPAPASAAAGSGGGGGFAPFLDPVLQQLLPFAQSPEEGVRNMVAECFGALVVMFPRQIVGELRTLVDQGAQASAAAAKAAAAAAAGGEAGGSGGGGSADGGVAMRWTAAASLKYAMNSAASSSSFSAPSASASAAAAAVPPPATTAEGSPEAVLQEHLGAFLALLEDEDLGVVHATLQLCNAAVHHQPHLAAPLLAPTIAPALYTRVTFKQERIVDLGPFKQKVDDGLPLRKAALATVNTVLDTMPERFDVAAFVAPLKSGLEDEKDTATLSHQILAKVCANPLFTGVVLGNLDTLVAPLLAAIKKTKQLMDKKVKEGQAGGTEVERLNDYVRSCVRAFLAVDSIAVTEEAMASSVQFKGLKELVDTTEPLRQMAEAIKSEA